MVNLARADMTFHADCWVELHAAVQAQYTERARDEGVPALVDPYKRTGMASWLPEAAIDEAVENLTEGLEEQFARSVGVESGEPLDELGAPEVAEG
jgi:hypothetical protein